MNEEESLYDVEIETYVEDLCSSGFVLEHHPVGSYFICGEKNTDYDVLVLFKEDLCFKKIREALEQTQPNIKFVYTDYSKMKGDFLSGKLITEGTGRTLNFICCRNKSFFDNFVKATKVCKILCVKDKKQRIAVHDFLLYGGPKKPKTDANFNLGFPVDAVDQPAGAMFLRPINLLGEWIRYEV